MKIWVNDREIAAEDGDTILDALRREGITVPTLCNMKDLLPTGTCRLCVVEVEGSRGLVPACSQPATPGMKIQTHSVRTQRARKTIIELLLADHPDDCLYCVRNTRCDLQTFARDLGVRKRRYLGKQSVRHMDVSSPSIVRDQRKCILCGKCVRVCEEIQGVAAIDFVGRGSRAHVGTAFDCGLNLSSCINCGQCINVCPTGALTEQSHLKEVHEALRDPKRTVVIQHAPAVSVTIAEEFGLRPGTDAIGALTTALRRIGFDYVFDTSYSADLTIMEEASELVARIKSGGTLPMMTSCSPGWIKFVEQFYPHRMPNLSTCKSPQQMLGAVIKTHWAAKQGLSPQSIFSVSVMPCTAKKFEAARPEMGRGGVPDLDAVLTTRELVRLIKDRGLDLSTLEPSAADAPFGTRSSAGKLFGATGGVAEAALRTAYFFLTGEELPMPKIKPLRGLDGTKEMRVSVAGLDLGIAVVNGLANARKLMDQIDAGRNDIHFIEVMTCPGGCISGGGQPIGADQAAIRARMKALYEIDRDATLRTSHGNEAIAELYRDFLGKPLGEVSHRLLHTHYTERQVLM